MNFTDAFDGSELHLRYGQTFLRIFHYLMGQMQLFIASCLLQFQKDLYVIPPRHVKRVKCYLLTNLVWSEFTII